MQNFLHLDRHRLASLSRSDLLYFFKGARPSGVACPGWPQSFSVHRQACGSRFSPGRRLYARRVPWLATSLAVVGICTNDWEAYPDDRPDRLADQARRASWTFPYLLDTEQTVGRAFAAACTPDFFLYDARRRLAYRGAFDESTPGNGKPVTGALLGAAISRVLAGEPVPEPHRPSMGCSIKWRS